MGTYTDASKVAGITQFTDGASTSPTTTQITQWITEVEADADARALGTYALTDQVIDVPSEVDYPPKNTIAWLEAIAGGGYNEAVKRMLIPPFTPIISITSLYRRTTGLTETASWEQLTEGPGSAASFVLIKQRTKTNQYLGMAIYFYQNEPDPGLGRIKMTYNHGWNLSTSIIGEWCTLKVALKVLDVLMRTETPYGSRDYSVGDTRVSMDLESTVTNIKERIKDLEDRYFPKGKLAIGFF